MQISEEKSETHSDHTGDNGLLHRAEALLSMFDRLRVRSGGHFLFGDPALETLLHLLVAENQRRRLSLKSIAHATAMPQSTAIRWVERLIAGQYVSRQENPADRRVAHVLLLPRGREFALSALSAFSETGS